MGEKRHSLVAVLRECHRDTKAVSGMSPLAKVRYGVGFLRNYGFSRCSVCRSLQCKKVERTQVRPTLYSMHTKQPQERHRVGCIDISAQPRVANSQRWSIPIYLGHIYLTMRIMTIDSEGRPNGQIQRITKEMNGPKGTFCPGT